MTSLHQLYSSPITQEKVVLACLLVKLKLEMKVAFTKQSLELQFFTSPCCDLCWHTIITQLANLK